MQVRAPCSLEWKCTQMQFLGDYRKASQLSAWGEPHSGAGSSHLNDYRESLPQEITFCPQAWYPVSLNAANKETPPLDKQNPHHKAGFKKRLRMTESKQFLTVSPHLSPLHGCYHDTCCVQTLLSLRSVSLAYMWT